MPLKGSCCGKWKHFRLSKPTSQLCFNAGAEDWRELELQTTSLDEPVENDKGDDLYIDFKAEVLNPEEKFIKHQRCVSVRGMIEKLDDKYKFLIKLRYYEEYSYEEIADELNIPLGTVKAQLFRAKELLCKLLENSIERI